MKRSRHTFPGCGCTALATSLYILNSYIAIQDVDELNRIRTLYYGVCPKHMRAFRSKLDKVCRDFTERAKMKANPTPVMNPIEALKIRARKRGSR